MARWLIPKIHTLETREECKKLLENGYTLINNEGYTVELRPNGTQKWSNPNRKKAYDFTHPYYWQCIDFDEGNTYREQIQDTQSLWFKFNYMLVWCGSRFL